MEIGGWTIEGLDSNKNGKKNIDEIKAGENPGAQ